MRKLVRKSYTPVVPIANTCSIGYPHDGRADNAAYRHDRRADNAAYRHDRRADSLSHCQFDVSQVNYSDSEEHLPTGPACKNSSHNIASDTLSSRPPTYTVASEKHR